MEALYRFRPCKIDAREVFPRHAAPLRHGQPPASPPES
ncbi:hypothetical protein ACP4OV_014452 [Aristida adscensionis]